jgi:hypothetical protein
MEAGKTEICLILVTKTHEKQPNGNKADKLRVASGLTMAYNNTVSNSELGNSSISFIIAQKNIISTQVKMHSTEMQLTSRHFV